MGRLVSSFSIRPLRLLIALAIVLSGLIVMPSPGRADVDLTVTPSLLDVSAEAGGEADQPIVLENKSDEPLTLSVEIVRPTAVPDEYIALDWVTIDRETIEIDANDATTLTAGLEIPKDATSGGHYATIRLRTVGAVGTDGAALAGEILVPVLFDIDGKGEVNRSGEIGDFGAFMEADGRIGFRAEFSNTGNTHLLAPGAVTIAGPDGSAITALNLQETTFILPGQTRDLTALGTVPLQPGTDYSAHIDLAYGQAEPTTADVTFQLDDLHPELTQLNVCENIDGGPSLSIGVENPSSLGQVPLVQVQVLNALDALVVDTYMPGQTLLWPSEVQTLTMQAPERLPTGSYTFSVTMQVGASTPSTIKLPFDIGGASPLVAPLCGA